MAEEVVAKQVVIQVAQLAETVATVETPASMTHHLASAVFLRQCMVYLADLSECRHGLGVRHHMLYNDVLLWDNLEYKYRTTNISPSISTETFAFGQYQRVGRYIPKILVVVVVVVAGQMVVVVVVAGQMVVVVVVVARDSIGLNQNHNSNLPDM
jgi:hypothetical protein